MQMIAVQTRALDLGRRRIDDYLDGLDSAQRSAVHIRIAGHTVAGQKNRKSKADRKSARSHTLILYWEHPCTRRQPEPGSTRATIRDSYGCKRETAQGTHAAHQRL